MARVRVMAVKLEVRAGPWPVPRLGYRAQHYSEDGRELLWTCTHDHDTALEAHTCGLEHLPAPQIEPPQLTQTA